MWIHEEDESRRTEIWDFLRFLDGYVYRAANLIVSHQYFNDFYEDRILVNDEEIGSFSEEIRRRYSKLRQIRDGEEKGFLQAEIERLKLQEKESKEKARSDFYKMTRQGTTYKLLSKQFPEIPSDILSCLNIQIYKAIVKEKKDVMLGKQSIRTYRKGMPVPFKFPKQERGNTTHSPRLRFDQEKKEYFLDWLNNISFILRFGRDKSNNHLIVERVVGSEYTLCDSSIQIDDHKIFLLLVVEIPNQQKERNAGISVGVDLGVSVPAYCALSEGFARVAIGNSNDFLRVRLQMQRRRRLLQRSLMLTSGGKGRDKKLKALENLRDKERHFARTYNHTVTKRIIEFADKFNAGVIKLELLEGYGKDDNGRQLKGNFILRNWSYYELQMLLREKAVRDGIRVVYVDPYHTSQTCAQCGHYEEGQRVNQRDFICKNPDCPNKENKGERKGQNAIVNADYNAALNIARSIKTVTKKEECEFYKRTHILL